MGLLTADDNVAADDVDEVEDLVGVVVVVVVVAVVRVWDVRLLSCVAVSVVFLESTAIRVENSDHSRIPFFHINVYGGSPSLLSWSTSTGPF